MTHGKDKNFMQTAANIEAFKSTPTKFWMCKKFIGRHSSAKILLLILGSVEPSSANRELSTLRRHLLANSMWNHDNPSI